VFYCPSQDPRCQWIPENPRQSRHCASNSCAIWIRARRKALDLVLSGRNVVQLRIQRNGGPGRSRISVATGYGGIELREPR
jgi:hypothetical protein